MRCSRNFSHNCVNASSWVWRKRVFFQNGDSERWSFCRACRVMASRVMSGSVTRTIFHMKGCNFNVTLQPWGSIRSSVFVGGDVFFVVGLVGSKLPQTKMHRWIGCLMDFLGFNSWPCLTCFVFFLGLGFLILEAPGTVLVMFFFLHIGVIPEPRDEYVNDEYVSYLHACVRLGHHRIESWTFCRILAHFLACLELRTRSDSGRKQWDAWKCGTDITSKREPVLCMENKLE